MPQCRGHGNPPYFYDWGEFLPPRQNFIRQSAVLGLYYFVKQLGFPPAQHDIAGLVEQLQSSPWDERKLALAKLISFDAEEELTDCLTSSDPRTCQLAAAGLWECWLNEQGPEPRHIMDWAIDLLEDGQLESAEQVFRDLSAQYPGWAEPVHKRAAILCLRGSYRLSYELSEWVVEVKPNHFAAWHNLALCALHLEDWEMAYSAAEESLRINPRYNPNINREIIRTAKARLEAGD